MLTRYAVFPTLSPLMSHPELWQKFIKLGMSHPELWQKFPKPGVQGSPCRGLGELAGGKIKSPKTFFLAFCMPPQAAQEGKEVFGDTPNPDKGLPPSVLLLAKRAGGAGTAPQQCGMTHILLRKRVSRALYALKNSG
jgi:hypothetical protein